MSNKRWRKDYNARREYHKQYIKKNRRRRLIYKLKKRYGITMQQFKEMLIVQKNKCCICEEKPEKGRFYVDHLGDKVRGLLCLKCNTALGLFGEKLVNLTRALKYLKERGSRD